MGLSRRPSGFLQLTSDSRHLFSFAWGPGFGLQANAICISFIKCWAKPPRLRKTYVEETGGGESFPTDPLGSLHAPEHPPAFLPWSPSLGEVVAWLELKPQAGPGSQED